MITHVQRVRVYEKHELALVDSYSNIIDCYVESH